MVALWTCEARVPRGCKQCVGKGKGTQRTVGPVRQPRRGVLEAPRTVAIVLYHVTDASQPDRNCHKIAARSPLHCMAATMLKRVTRGGAQIQHCHCLHPQSINAARTCILFCERKCSHLALIAVTARVARESRSVLRLTVYSGQ